MKPSRCYWILSALSLGFLCFLAGFITTTLQVFPYQILRDGFLGLEARANLAELDDWDMYVTVKSGRTGVTRYDPKRAYNGYTLFTSADAQSAFLVDMDGRLVHQWSLPYSQIWNSHAAVKQPVASKFIFWRKAYLYPNGDLLAVYESWADHPFGYGLVKMDRNSRPIWTFLERAHHSVTVGPDGKVYTLSHRSADQAIPGLPALAPAYYEDFIDVLASDGKMLNHVSLLRAFADSPFSRLVGLQRNSGDPLHTNSVRAVPASWAKGLGLSGSNYVLVSARNLDSIALVDLDSAKVVWVRHGPFARQHNADLLPDGDITVFDNLGDTAHGGASRILEFAPSPFRIVWEFPGKSGEALDSGILGSAQRLANGNTLITEAEGGRLLEVTPTKEVVWQYESPFRHGDKHQYVAVVFSGHRFAPDELHFEFNRRPIAGLHAVTREKQ